VRWELTVINMLEEKSSHKRGKRIWTKISVKLERKWRSFHSICSRIQWYTGGTNGLWRGNPDELFIICWPGGSKRC
jgi:hypothetical protein